MAKVDFFTSPESLIPAELKPGTGAYAEALEQAKRQITRALAKAEERGRILAEAEESYTAGLLAEGVVQRHPELPPLRQ